MRDHTKAFSRLIAEIFDCPGPIYEFGSYQVEGQEDYADLRAMFPGKPFVGCDMRPGLGVDRVEDVTDVQLPDETAGTILCIETFEHVFEVRRAFDEVYRLLKPGGMFIITSPLNFRIHAYPDDYWRMTPSCLRRLMSPYEAKVVGFQGYHKFPHTVMAIGAKTPIPLDFADRANQFTAAYQVWLDQSELSRPWQVRAREKIARMHRSKGERYHVDAYYKTEFILDLPPEEYEPSHRSSVNHVHAGQSGVIHPPHARPVRWHQPTA